MNTHQNDCSLLLMIYIEITTMILAVKVSLELASVFEIYDYADTAMMLQANHFQLIWWVLYDWFSQIPFYLASMLSGYRSLDNKQDIK